jgi:DNA polymerase I-like protein with 3'-5' exonuclease and polymerase domains
MKYVVPYENVYRRKQFDHKVKLLLSVHDQQVSEVREDYAEQWAFTQTELMEKQQCMLYHQEFLKQSERLWPTG